MDNDATIQELKQKVSEFRDTRDWLEYDTPKNLAISISLEAAELLEHFQWNTDEQVAELMRSRAKQLEVSDELADVLIYCLGFADALKIDLSKALDRKLERNGERYPAKMRENRRKDRRVSPKASGGQLPVSLSASLKTF